MEGKEAFGARLVGVDWMKEFENVPQDPTSLVERMDSVFGEIVNDCFKTCRRTVKDSDLPWISAEFKKELRKRRRVYNAQERSDDWKKQKKITDSVLRKDKAAYYNKMKQCLTQNGAHQIPYRAVKQLKGGERPLLWDVRDINPELDDQETAEHLADFVNSISNEFDPLTSAHVPPLYDKS